MRIRMRRGVAAALTVSALCFSAAACGTEDEKKPAAAGDKAKDKGEEKPAAPLTAAQMKAALLEVKDLPAGWKSSPAAKDDDIAKVDKPECKALGTVLSGKVEGATMGDTHDFEGAAGTSILSEQVYTFAGTGAVDHMKALSDAVGVCKSFAVTGDEGFPVKVETLAAPKAAEESLTFKMTLQIPGLGQGISSNLLVMRQGNGVARIAHVPGEEKLAKDFDDLVKRAGDKFVKGAQS
ncbi:hypothetical protein OG883_24405 [Streptomyces sp. NBC_01142]|uniref:hypothetical protein n=1 Tax=Streptomyces sp. NBC_01142 TaxID=2975865 RepID=UPI002257D637|nr:hypothetical protein [Streptomyces sp. NBC_01142]MCX4822976.1 hypothetical protein [Streptomyces sp. NBC_01142]